MIDISCPENNPELTFKDVIGGDTFHCLETDYTYLKLPAVLYNDMKRGAAKFNCYCLAEEEFHFLGDYEEVKLVDLNIKVKFRS